MHMNRIYDSFGFLFAKASNQLQDKLSDFLSKSNLTPCFPSILFFTTKDS